MEGYLLQSAGLSYDPLEKKDESRDEQFAKRLSVLGHNVDSESIFCFDDMSFDQAYALFTAVIQELPDGKEILTEIKKEYEYWIFPEPCENCKSAKSDIDKQPNDKKTIKVQKKIPSMPQMVPQEMYLTLKKEIPKSKHHRFELQQFKVYIDGLFKWLHDAETCAQQHMDQSEQVDVLEHIALVLPVYSQVSKKLLELLKQKSEYLSNMFSSIWTATLQLLRHLMHTVEKSMSRHQKEFVDLKLKHQRVQEIIVRALAKLETVKAGVDDLDNELEIMDSAMRAMTKEMSWLFQQETYHYTRIQDALRSLTGYESFDQNDLPWSTVTEAIYVESKDMAQMAARKKPMEEIDSDEIGEDVKFTQNSISKRENFDVYGKDNSEQLDAIAAAEKAAQLAYSTMHEQDVLSPEGIAELIKVQKECSMLRELAEESCQWRWDMGMQQVGVQSIAEVIHMKAKEEGKGNVEKSFHSEFWNQDITSQQQLEDDVSVGEVSEFGSARRGKIITANQSKLRFTLPKPFTPLLQTDVIERYQPRKKSTRTLTQLHNLINHMYLEYSSELDITSNTNFAIFLYEFFMIHHGVHEETEELLVDFLQDVHLNLNKSVMVHLFGQFCNLVEPYLETDDLLFNLKVISKCTGRGKDKHTKLIQTEDGSQWIPMEIAVTVVQTSFSDGEAVYLKLLHKLQDLVHVISNVDQTESSSMINVGDLTKIMMQEYQVEKTSVRKRLMAMFIAGDVNQDGVLTFDEFRDLINALDRNRTDYEISHMYREGHELSNSGNQELDPEIFAHVCRKHDLFSFFQDPEALTNSNHLLQTRLEQTWKREKNQIVRKIKILQMRAKSNKKARAKIVEHSKRLETFVKLFHSKTNVCEAWDAYNLLYVNLEAASEDVSNKMEQSVN